jgi:hypothetical protein
MAEEQDQEQGDVHDHGSGNKHDHGRRHGHDHGNTIPEKRVGVSHGHDHAQLDQADPEHAGHDHSGHDHHGHHHGIGHSHAPASFGKAFAIGTALNLGFVVVEAIYGVISDSVALLADAGHNLSDVLGLVMAWVAMSLSRRQPSASPAPDSPMACAAARSSLPCSMPCSYWSPSAASSGRPCGACKIRRKSPASR